MRRGGGPRQPGGGRQIAGPRGHDRGGSTAQRRKKRFSDRPKRAWPKKQDRQPDQSRKPADAPAPKRAEATQAPATGVQTTAVTPDPGIIREFVFEPIESLGVRFAFGFGKDWIRLLLDLDLPVVHLLGQGGRAYPASTPNRTWLVCDAPGGIQIAAMKTKSRPVPPTRAEVLILKHILGG